MLVQKFKLEPQLNQSINVSSDVKFLGVHTLKEYDSESCRIETVPYLFYIDSGTGNFLQFNITIVEDDCIGFDYPASYLGSFKMNEDTVIFHVFTYY